MTIHNSGTPLKMTELRTEYLGYSNLGYGLGAYLGKFPGSDWTPISMSEFYGVNGELYFTDGHYTDAGTSYGMGISGYGFSSGFGGNMSIFDNIIGKTGSQAGIVGCFFYLNVVVLRLIAATGYLYANADTTFKSLKIKVNSSLYSYERSAGTYSSGSGYKQWAWSSSNIFGTSDGSPCYVQLWTF